MKKENNKKTIKEEVVSKIKKGEVKMKSRSFFILKTVLTFGLIVLLSLLVLYLGSLIVFVFRANDMMLFSGMGFQGIRIVLLSFPWYLFVLVVILIVFVEIIAKNFSFVYRRPLIYSFIGIVFLVALGSLMVEAMSVHDSFFDMAKEERLPVAGGMYKHLGRLDMDSAYFGTLLDKDGTVWTMELDSGEEVILEITTITRGFRILNELKEGSTVVVIGDREGDIINVMSFKRINGKGRRNER